MAPPLRIAIVEDHPEALAALSCAAQECGRLLWQVTTLLAAKRALQSEPPDLLLVDIGLPDGNGLDLLPLAANQPGTRTLVVSAAGDEPTVLKAIEWGAAGYLLKELTTAQIVQAIRDIDAGGAPVTPRLAMFILKRLRGHAAQAPLTEQLTERESDILDGLARGQSYAELAAASHVSYHTINSHVKSIYRKLAVTSRTQAVYRAVTSGLVRLD